VTRITLTASERSELFVEAAARRGLSPVVVEKDYWVCVALCALFGEPQPVELVFKGGTSLSKCYGLIDRFSEDVDLAFDRAGLGFHGETDPEAQGLSNKRRKTLVEELSAATAAYVSGPFRDATVERLKALLPNEAWSLDVDGDDAQTLLFAYPPSLDASLYSATDYVRPAVRLELGARSDPTPSELREVASIATEEFGYELSHLAPIAVPTLSATRTFWEKASLLHADNHREQPFKPARARSRHLYDLVQLMRSVHGDEAIDDVALRDRVAQHKSLFFASASARYDLFTPPTIRLLPQDEDALARLRSDYADMRDMFFGEQPAFAHLVGELKRLEARLNG
jgi:hypothetical protein